MNPILRNCLNHTAVACGLFATAVSLQAQTLSSPVAGGAKPAATAPGFDVPAGQGLTALLAWALQLEKSVLIGAMAWPVELVSVPVLALGVALASALLPAWEAYRVSVFELLQSR